MFLTHDWRGDCFWHHLLKVEAFLMPTTPLKSIYLTSMMPIANKRAGNWRTTQCQNHMPSSSSAHHNITEYQVADQGTQTRPQQQKQKQNRTLQCNRLPLKYTIKQHDYLRFTWGTAAFVFWTWANGKWNGKGNENANATNWWRFSKVIDRNNPQYGDFKCYNRDYCSSVQVFCP